MKTSTTKLIATIATVAATLSASAVFAIGPGGFSVGGGSRGFQRPGSASIKSSISNFKSKGTTSYGQGFANKSYGNEISGNGNHHIAIRSNGVSLTINKSHGHVTFNQQGENYPVAVDSCRSVVHEYSEPSEYQPSLPAPAPRFVSNPEPSYVEPSFVEPAVTAPVQPPVNYVNYQPEAPVYEQPEVSNPGYEPSHCNYFVQPGDSFYEVSLKEYGTSDAAEAIAAFNRMPPNTILRQGQLIFLPSVSPEGELAPSHARPAGVK